MLTFVIEDKKLGYELRRWADGVWTIHCTRCDTQEAGGSHETVCHVFWPKTSQPHNCRRN